MMPAGFSQQRAIVAATEIAVVPAQINDPDALASRSKTKLIIKTDDRMAGIIRPPVAHIIDNNN